MGEKGNARQWSLRKDKENFLRQEEVEKARQVKGGAGKAREERVGRSICGMD